MIPIGLCSVSISERHADALKVPVALSEPAHYIKAEHLLAQIEANPALSNETEISLISDPGCRPSHPCCGGGHRAGFCRLRQPGKAEGGRFQAMDRPF